MLDVNRKDGGGLKAAEYGNAVLSVPFFCKTALKNKVFLKNTLSDTLDTLLLLTSICSLVISQGLWANTLLSSPKFCSF